MKIELSAFERAIAGEVIEEQEACHKCGGPLTVSTPDVIVVLVGRAGAYPYVLVECEACHLYYWQVRESKCEDENS